MDERIRVLQEERESISKEISRLQLECEHKTISKIQYPYYSGTAVEKRCKDCGKMLGAYAGMGPEPEDADAEKVDPSFVLRRRQSS